MTFKELGLKDEFLQAVEKLGFETPSEIQEKAIPVLSEGDRDFVGLAQTGTGKTAAFGLPLLNYIDFNNSDTQGLIICPTRELCMQISRDLVSFAAFSKRASILPVYGGASIVDQIRTIKKGVHVIVATPGRLLDLIKRRAITLGKVQRVILDEADEMLNMGFKEDIDSILEQTPNYKKVWLFSATMPREVRRIAQNYMEDPFEVTVGKQNSSAANIEHQYFMMKERDRYDALKRLLDFNPDVYGLIFCRTKRETGMISDKLEKEGYNVVALHGDLSQAQRDSAMNKFRNKTAKILVATDVAARGIDVDEITHVIHHKLPDEIENYTHRSGRTARAGKKGVSIALINTREQSKIRQIEKMIGAKIEYAKIPEGEDIVGNQLMAAMEKVLATEVDQKAIEKYWPSIQEKLGDLPAEEIIFKFIAKEMKGFLDYYKKGGNINESEDRVRPQKSEKDFNSPMQRYFISCGEKDNLNAGALVRLICTETGLPSSQLGKVDIHPAYSFFEVSLDVKDKVLPSMAKGTYEEREFEVEETEARPASERRGGGGGRSYGGGGRGRSSSGGRGGGSYRGGERGDKGRSERSSGGGGRSYGGGDRGDRSRSRDNDSRGGGRSDRSPRSERSPRKSDGRSSRKNSTPYQEVPSGPNRKERRAHLQKQLDAQKGDDK